MIKNGDCLDELREMPDNFFDAIVTDPPYELGFMGKSWDATGIAYNVDLWREVLRVLKPGGHLLAFSGSRTYHRMACAIEDAGFEVRDMIEWLYGTGFPKSLDVSKAIDKGAGYEQPIVEEGASGKGALSVNALGSGLNVNFAARPKTAPVTAAAAWKGWGTALKPGHEPICMARKPLDGTVAANVLTHGTGALNIDASRVGSEARPIMVRTETVVAAKSMSGESTRATSSGETTTQGRWPANVILDADAAVELDAQSGTLKSGANPTRRGADGERVALGAFAGQESCAAPRGVDIGGASRFFYVAKPSRAERDAGCDNLPTRSGGEATEREDGSDGLKSPRAGAGRTGGARNHHPTVKPVALMRHLIRLVTPPGGVVLDPFVGSGSTGVAALLEGFDFVGIEREAEYIPIIEARIAHAVKAA